MRAKEEKRLRIAQRDAVLQAHSDAAGRGERIDYAALYGALHESQKTFPGRSIRVSVPIIAELVAIVAKRIDFEPRLLDYGCGKGHQYLAMRVHEQWGGILPVCYDIGVRGLSEPPPARAFDGVICTDVMEHIARRDVPAVLADVFSKLSPGPAFAHFSIACRASQKQLPDGRDIHLTVETPEWWIAQLEQFRRPGLIIDARFDRDTQSEGFRHRFDD